MRPRLHFTARSGWINDPHGITYRDNEYHLFFQHVPGSTVWAANCHWGHASGPDLLSLRELPIAIAPGDGDDGIWTGSLVTDDGGETRAFYTSTNAPDFGIGRIRVATPDDDGWISWSKGPIVAEAPPELDIIAYRDPYVRREGAGWRMFVGAGLRDGTATALSYYSDNLKTWNYDGIALQRSTTETEGVWMGALWECPQIFDVDGCTVMVSSIWDDDVLHYAGYAIGSYNEGVFTAETWGRLTYGDSYYAPSHFTDADGRPCLLFWMRGIGGADTGWASALSVPHVLSVKDGRLAATPHPDVSAHRVPALEGEMAARAVDIEWAGTHGDLTVRNGDHTVAVIQRDSESLRILVEGETTTIPATGLARIIVDGPTLEVSSMGAIFGARVHDAGGPLSAHSSAGQTDVFALR